jgi:hypothetical protein
MIGHMFTGNQKQLRNFVAIRFERDFDVMPVLEKTIKASLFDSSSQVSLELEFTQKAELKVSAR